MDRLVQFRVCSLDFEKYDQFSLHSQSSRKTENDTGCMCEIATLILDYPLVTHPLYVHQDSLFIRFFAWQHFPWHSPFYIISYVFEHTPSWCTTVPSHGWVEILTSRIDTLIGLGWCFVYYEPLKRACFYSRLCCLLWTVKASAKDSYVWIEKNPCLLGKMFESRFPHASGREEG